jgi:hypothetical protein
MEEERTLPEEKEQDEFAPDVCYNPDFLKGY